MNEQNKRDCLRLLTWFSKSNHSFFPSDLQSKVERSSLYVEENFFNVNRSESVQKSLASLKKSANVVVFLINSKSLAIGQEIAISLSLQKPTIVLYKSGTKKPHILEDCGKELLIYAPYSDTDLEQVIEGALDFAKGLQEFKFNFFISFKQNQYLNWLSLRYKASKASIIRAFIQSHMDQDRVYERETSTPNSPTLPYTKNSAIMDVCRE